MTSAKAASSPFAGVAEYFTLRRASEVSARLDDGARKDIGNSLALGRQKAEAAETLWANGHNAEGLRLAVESLEATVAIAPTYATGMKLAQTPAAASAPAVASAPATAAAPPSEATDAEPKDEGEDASLESSSLESSSLESSSLESSNLESSGAESTSEPEPTAALDERAAREVALRDRGARPAEIEAIEGALAAARAVSLPALDAEIAPAHTQLYERITHARRVADRRFDTAAYAPRQVKVTRVARIVSTALIALIVLVALYLATRRPEFTVVASEVWGNSPDFQPEKVADGRAESWWLLPDGQQGWVEVRFTSPRHIERISLINTANAPHMDRGTNEYAVEIYSGGRVARTIEGSFEFSPRPEEVLHDVGVDDVQRIRFVVRSHHRTGAGLSELHWE